MPYIYVIKSIRLLLILLFLLFCLCSTAQTTIVGTASDKHNHPLASISVTLSHRADIMQRRLAITDTAGIFSFKNIHKGTYSLLVTGAGFRPGGPASLTVADGALMVLPTEEQERL